MDLVVRYSEIHKKQGNVRKRFVQTLRQRVQDKLEFEGLYYGKVAVKPGRITVEDTVRDSRVVAELPGVKSCSIAEKTGPEIEEVKKAFPLDFNTSFGVRINLRGLEDSSQDWEEEIGSFVQQETGEEVDLEDPGIWLKAEVTEDHAHVFTSEDSFEGPGGLPAGVEGKVLSMISGGIDSPVAAFEALKRGLDVTPIYFYDRPYAAEDHLARFEAVVRELKRFHPGKDWSYILVDMEEVNKALSSVEKGRMVLHRRAMFKVAERVREERGLDGTVTGESFNQKSSQTPRNLFASSRDLPVFRPLLNENKVDIQEQACRIGTFEHSKIDSACKKMVPDSPATSMDPERLEELEKYIGLERLVEQAFESSKEEEI
ncbi:MAG: tRNA sulfurtransferase [Candidatus Nanohaloarchaea archaeon]